MGVNEGTKKVPIKDGLFKLIGDGEDGYLVGGQCGECGEVFFPKRHICANCFSEEMKEVPLSKTGKIISYTIARTGFPGGVVNPPFISAVVELPPRLRLVTLITGYDLDRVEIGAEVDLYFWKTGEDEKGNHLMAFAFRRRETN